MSYSDSELLEFVTAQRWYGAKGREATSATVLDRAFLGDELSLLLVEIRFAAGSHELFQLVTSRDEQSLERDELLADPGRGRVLAQLLSEKATLESESATVEFCSSGSTVAAPLEARSIGVEQSNSSIVLDEGAILKLYRRLEAGVNPELELLRFLSQHEFSNVPELTGWWSYSGALMSATLGIVQRFIPGGVDGWSLALAELSSEPESFLDRVERLGEVVGALHAVLASDADDPAFAPEEASPETLALLRASVDDEIGEVFDHLPDDDSVAPIAGCGGAVRDLLGELANFGSTGKVIRHHGDLHLGQALRSDGDWFIVDFEGEPARSLPERRVKRSPLRDVAGMLRSFAYASRLSGADEATEQGARGRFLNGYFEQVDAAGILPPPHQTTRLIEIFELEKAVYELRYELSHRPDWVHIPVAGIESLLKQASA